MAPRRRLLLLWLAVSGCFSEAADVAGTGDTSGAVSTGSGDPQATSGTMGPRGGTAASGSVGASTGNDWMTSSDDGAAVDNDTVESTDSGEEGLGPYGSPCVSNDECEGGLCAVVDDPPGSCTARCDPTAGGCAAVGHAAFCVKFVSSQFGCLGELDTGDDLEDGLLRVGATLSGSLDGSDWDAFYLENPVPDWYTVTAYPSAGLNIMITMYTQAVVVTARDAAGIQGIEEVGYNSAGDAATYPRYPVIVVSAVGGTSGSYEVRLEQP